MEGLIIEGRKGTVIATIHETPCRDLIKNEILENFYKQSSDYTHTTATDSL